MADLTCHPAHPPALVRSIETRVIGLDARWLRIRWRILGAQKLVIPSFAGKGRANDMWQTTCFELFLQQPGSSGYIEFNLSPSERWNAYDFSARREGMTERPMPREPECTMRKGSDIAVFDVAIPAAGLPEGQLYGALTAVIEEEGGMKSYWAMLHTADAPDFHDPACFTVPLAAPTAS